MIGLAVSSWMYSREKAARERAVAAEQAQARLRQQADAARKTAETEASKSQQVAQFLKDMLQGVGPSVALGRDTKLLREVLDKTAERLGRDLKDQSEVEAELRTSIGNVYKQLAEYEKAETMYRAVLRLRQSSLGPDDPAAVSSLLNIADCLVARGDITGAEALLHEALASQGKSIAGGKPTDAAAYDSRLDASRRSQFLAEVQVIQRRLLEARRKLKGADDPVVTRTLGNIGGVAAEQGELDIRQPRRQVARHLRCSASCFPTTTRTLSWPLTTLARCRWHAAIRATRSRCFASRWPCREDFSMINPLWSRVR